MGEAFLSMWGSWTGGGDLVDSAVLRYRQSCVYEVTYHIRNNLIEGTEELWRVHPYHQKDHIDADNDAIIIWCHWDNV